MEGKHDGQQQRKSRGSEEEGGIKPSSRKAKSTLSVEDTPLFRSTSSLMAATASSGLSAMMETPQTSNFMAAAASSGYSPFAAPRAAVAGADVPPIEVKTTNPPTKPPPAVVSKQQTPTPFGISKEHMGSHQLFLQQQKQQSFAKSVVVSPPTSATGRTVPVWDLKTTSISSDKYSSWESPSMGKLPKYYPLEPTNTSIRLDEEHSLHDLLSRLSEAFRIMSVQAIYFDQPASAALLTPENVELYVALWQSSDDPKSVTVEVQRRHGDAIIFHKYARHILEAASGSFDQSLFANDEGSILYLQSAERILRAELSRIAPNSDMDKESVMALELVYGLLTKDRRDARQLGMEGVCILVNARKSVLSAAILTSRAILLGGELQASKGLHDILLNVIKHRKIGSSKVKGEYPDDSDDEEYFLDEDEAMRDYSLEDKEEMTLLFNLALDAVAHALEVVTTFAVDASSNVSAAEVIETFLTETGLLPVFLEILQRAYLKPHNAWLAAKCLRFACSACPDAAERTVKIGGMQCVENAHDVGISSHAKLESECRSLYGILTH